MDFDKCVTSHIHYHSIVQSSFRVLKISRTSSIYSSLSLPELLETTDHFVVFVILHFLECHVFGIAPMLPFQPGSFHRAMRI